MVELINQTDYKEKITENYIQSKLNEYKEVMLLIVDESMYKEKMNNINAFIEAAKDTYSLKYTMVVISNDNIKKSIINIFPDFSKYPTTIISKDGDFFRVLEEDFFNNI